jgi:hypothetical protein
VDSTKSKNNIFWLVLFLLLMVGGIVVYTLFDPNKSVWMPKCPFRLLTGWNCPACGLQRALHALLHGRFAEALSYNYFFVVSIPYVIALFVAEALKRIPRGDNFIRAVEHPVLARVYIILFIAWGIIRNLLQV